MKLTHKRRPDLPNDTARQGDLIMDRTTRTVTYLVAKDEFSNNLRWVHLENGVSYSPGTIGENWVVAPKGTAIELEV